MPLAIADSARLSAAWAGTAAMPIAAAVMMGRKFLFMRLQRPAREKVPRVFIRPHDRAAASSPLSGRSCRHDPPRPRRARPAARDRDPGGGPGATDEAREPGGPRRVPRVALR